MSDLPPPRHATAVAAATLTAVAMIAQLVAGKAVRDALLLSTYGPTALPNVMIASATLSLLGVLVFSRALARFGPTRVVPVTFAISGALLLGEWGLSHVTRQIAAVVVYCHMAVFGATLVSGFWSLVNERFDPHTAKRVIDRIVAGSTAGGVIGGLVGFLAASRLGTDGMLLLVAGLHLLCAVGAIPIGQRAQAPTADVVEEARSLGDAPSALQNLVKTPYLLSLAALIGVGALTEALLDYVFSVRAAATFHGGQQLLSFFALFHMGIGLLSFFVQWALTAGALRRLGLAGTIALLPLSVLTGGFVAILSTKLWSVAVVKTMEQVSKASFFRAAYEVLYTPLPERVKRPTKALIDVGFDRLGTVAGGAIAMLTLRFSSDRNAHFLVIAGVFLAIVSLALTRTLHRGYVATLEESLRSGAERLTDVEEAAPTSGRASQMLTMLPPKPSPTLRKAISQRLSQLRHGNRPEDLILASVADLRSGDVVRIRTTLAVSSPLPGELVAHTIPLLGNDELFADVLPALRAVATSHPGQLVDALRDPVYDGAVRRRLARVLTAAPIQHTADGLLELLVDDDFEVRYQAALALLRITEKNKEISIARDRVFAAARREAELGKTARDRGTVRDVMEEDRDLSLLSELQERSDRGLEHIFALLSLALEREPLKIAARALHTTDEALRGTALEYLENVLPDEVREALWPMFGDARAAAAAKKPSAQIIDELLHVRDAVTHALGALSNKERVSHA